MNTAGNSRIWITIADFTFRADNHYAMRTYKINIFLTEAYPLTNKYTFNRLYFNDFSEHCIIRPLYLKLGVLIEFKWRPNNRILRMTKTNFILVSKIWKYKSRGAFVSSYSWTTESVKVVKVRFLLLTNIRLLCGARGHHFTSPCVDILVSVANKLPSLHLCSSECRADHLLKCLPTNVKEHSLSCYLILRSGWGGKIHTFIKCEVVNVANSAGFWTRHVVFTFYA